MREPLTHYLLYLSRHCKFDPTVNVDSLCPCGKSLCLGPAKIAPDWSWVLHMTFNSLRLRLYSTTSVCGSCPLPALEGVPFINQPLWMTQATHGSSFLVQAKHYCTTVWNTVCSLITFRPHWAGPPSMSSTHRNVSMLTFIRNVYSSFSVRRLL